MIQKERDLSGSLFIFLVFFYEMLYKYIVSKSLKEMIFIMFSPRWQGGKPI